MSMRYKIYQKLIDSNERLYEKVKLGRQNLEWVNANMWWLPLKKHDVMNVDRGNRFKQWKFDFAERFYDIRMAFDEDFRNREIDAAIKRHDEAVDRQIEEKNLQVYQLTSRIKALGGSISE